MCLCVCVLRAPVRVCVYAQGACGPGRGRSCGATGFDVACPAGHCGWSCHQPAASPLAPHGLLSSLQQPTQNDMQPCCADFNRNCLPSRVRYNVGFRATDSASLTLNAHMHGTCCGAHACCIQSTVLHARSRLTGRVDLQTICCLACRGRPDGALLGIVACWHCCTVPCSLVPAVWSKATS